MEIYCTRPNCPRPQNHFADLDNITTLKSTQQKYCITCGMALLLDGRYVPTQILGKGGFGAAFLASDRRIPGMRLCVVKQFQPPGNLTPTQLQTAQNLFEREADALAQLGHEHEQIPELYAFFPVVVPSLQPGQQDQFFYLVQAFIDGQDLEAELSQKGKFTEAEVLQLLRELLPVLKFVHEKGIIHRDIKPSNIMRRRDGKIFLLDFGAVKQITSTPIGQQGVSTGIYSLGFAPPEQIAGGQVFPSTDLYALAVTIITLLTGRDPTQLFDAYTNQWQWHSAVTVSPKLADILDKMLLPAANQRFQSAAAVMAALTQVSFIPVTKITPDPPLPPAPPTPNFSLIQIILGAAFTGFEGALIAIALLALLKNAIFTGVITCVILAGLIFVQVKRWIEKFGLLIIPVITLAILSGLIQYIAIFHGMSIQVAIIQATAAGLISVATVLLFRLINTLLSLIL